MMKWFGNQQFFRYGLNKWRFFVLLIALGVIAYLICQVSTSDKKPEPRILVLYSFSIMEDVMNYAVLPAFKEEWTKRAGEKVEFVSVYAGSGAITKKIIKRFPAEVAILSSELDAVSLLEQSVVMKPSWKDLPYHGILSKSPLIILTREGNPANIGGFSDLTREGMRIIHMDPLTSGGAQWSILAVYGTALFLTGNTDYASSRLMGTWKNVIALEANARDALSQFVKGTGDILITYEQEALSNPSKERIQADVVYPSCTIASEHVVVKIDRNITPRQQQLVDAFVDFLWTEKAQQLFVDYGFRSVLDELNQSNTEFGVIESSFTLESLGGPKKVKRDIIESLWAKRILPEMRKRQVAHD